MSRIQNASLHLYSNLQTLDPVDTFTYYMHGVLLTVRSQIHENSGHCCRSQSVLFINSVKLHDLLLDGLVLLATSSAQDCYVGAAIAL